MYCPDPVKVCNAVADAYRRGVRDCAEVMKREARLSVCERHATEPRDDLDWGRMLDLAHCRDCGDEIDFDAADAAVAGLVGGGDG
jgi:hypothetical protein